MNFRFSPELPDKKGVYFVYVPNYINKTETSEKNIITCFIFILFENGKWSIDKEDAPSYVKAWLPISELYENLSHVVE